MNAILKEFERKIQSATHSELLDSFAEYVSIDRKQRTTEQYEALKLLRQEILSRMDSSEK